METEASKNNARAGPLTSGSAHAPPTMPRLELIHPWTAWTRGAGRIRVGSRRLLADDAASERTRLRVEDLRTAAVEARDALAAWARDRREPRVVMLDYPPGLDFLPRCSARWPQSCPCRSSPPTRAPALKVPGAGQGPGEIAERAGATLALTTRAYEPRGDAWRRASACATWPKRCGEDDSGRGTTREAA